jgi:hypothetical protein
LKREAVSLNEQLAVERERYGRLEQSFNRYEERQSERVSKLTNEAAAERLAKERYRGESNARLIVIIALAGAWVIVIGYKAYRLFRPLKI